MAVRALRSPYRYVAEAIDEDGRRLGVLPLEPDFEPAAEWVHFQRLRAGAVPPRARYGRGVVEPVADRALGRPYVEGVTVRFDADAGVDAARALSVPARYFQPSVEQSVARLVGEGRIEAGTRVRYRICATPAPARPQPPEDSSAEELPVALALAPRALGPRIARAVALGEAAAATPGTDYPVFLCRSILAETTAMAKAAGDTEVGGVLVGHLHRDTETSELHAEITAQIAARHTRASGTHLGFTHESWSAAREEIARREREEILLGWWHFHPFFCRRCERSRRRRCPLSRVFFSAADRSLHRTVFASAFHLALLVSDLGEEAPRHDLFGWREGRIEPRGCYVLPAQSALGREEGEGDGG